MPDAPDRLPSRRDRHRPTRALGALAAALAVVNGAFLWWPDVDLSPGLEAAPAPPEMVALELVEPTTQPPPPANLPPPPPPPDDDLPPVEVPDERVVEEVFEDLDLPPVPAPAPRPSRQPVRTARPAPPAPPGPPPPAPPAPPPASDRIVERPDRSPSLSGQALPVYPRDASERGFRGSARVRVLVNQGGRVTDAEILERVRFDDGREHPVAAFPPEFDRAILEAARRHVFRPARDGGERVRAFAFITVSLDPPG